MRRLFTASDRTKDELAWGVHTGRWQRVQRAVYAEGHEPVTALDRARAKVLASSSPARGALAGVLHRLDAVVLDDRPTRRDRLPDDRIVLIEGMPCADAVQTLVDLAALLDDDRWEQALESALRKRLVTVAAFDGARSTRIRRVLRGRPPGAPPTESLLETMALQLARPVLGEPTRQRVITWPDGTFVARVDLCWPEYRLFLELDGQHHKDQPVYDAHRQTAVVAATGWLPGRFTWTEITRLPRTTTKRLLQLKAQASAS